MIKYKVEVIRDGKYEPHTCAVPLEDAVRYAHALESIGLSGRIITQPGEPSPFEFRWGSECLIPAPQTCESNSEHRAQTD